jgi:hypothetical protein
MKAPSSSLAERDWLGMAEVRSASFTACIKSVHLVRIAAYWLEAGGFVKVGTRLTSASIRAAWSLNHAQSAGVMSLAKPAPIVAFAAAKSRSAQSPTSFAVDVARRCRAEAELHQSEAMWSCRSRPRVESHPPQPKPTSSQLTVLRRNLFEKPASGPP